MLQVVTSSAVYDVLLVYRLLYCNLYTLLTQSCSVECCYAMLSICTVYTVDFVYVILK